MSQTCPFCRTSLPAEASVCFQCNAEYGVGDYFKKFLSKKKAQTALKIMGGIFISCFGLGLMSFLAFHNGSRGTFAIIGVPLLFVAFLFFFPTLRLTVLAFSKEKWFR